MRCTMLKRAWRHCPGQPPQEIESERSTTSTEAPQRSDAWPEGRSPWGPEGRSPWGPEGRSPWGQQQEGHFPFSGGGGLGDIFGMFAQMEAQMESMFRGFGGMGDGTQLRPPPRAPTPRAPPQVQVDEV